MDGIATMRELFESGEDPAAVAGRANGERVALADCRLRAPIIPKKFFHTSGNFREHEDESKVVNWSHEIAPWIVFFQNVDAIIGPEDPIVYPSHLTDELDHELELALVISRSGSHFDEREAEGYIGGYLIFNDITARDIQRREMRSGVFSFCKAIDTFCPLGPWIVTPDEIPDPYKLDMELRVNGERRQKSVSGNMSLTIPEVIAHYSALGLQRRGRPLARDGGRGRWLPRGCRGLLPAAGGRGRVRDRADRGAPQSGGLVGAGARRARGAAPALVTMSWPRDYEKLDRVRALMAREELDALVVRAPDNVVYLTNYWCMKGYDALVFPASGEPVLVVLEPQLEEAGRTSLDTGSAGVLGLSPG